VRSFGASLDSEGLVILSFFSSLSSLDVSLQLLRMNQDRYNHAVLWRIIPERKPKFCFVLCLLFLASLRGIYCFWRGCNKLQQDRQCAYKVTMRRVRQLLLPCKSNKHYLLVYLCMRIRACSFVNRACKPCAPCCESFVAPLSPPRFSIIS
jgi:hypothetical protein